MRNFIARLRSRLALAALLVAGCSAVDPQASRVEPEPSGSFHLPETVRPLLGVPFGKLVTLKAQVVVSDPGKGPVRRLLLVARIDDRDVNPPLPVPWAYGWHADDRDAEPSTGEGPLVPGVLYRVRGYEAGQFVGLPVGVWAEFGDEFGPPQTSGFGFEHIFLVVRSAPWSQTGR